MPRRKGAVSAGRERSPPMSGSRKKPNAPRLVTVRVRVRGAGREGEGEGEGQTAGLREEG